MDPTAFVIPCLLAGVALYALTRRVDVYAALTQGAGEGLTVVAKILPALVGLLTAVYMLRASGAMDALAAALAPVLGLLGIPPETAALLLVRPVSGSGARRTRYTIPAALTADLAAFVAAAWAVRLCFG